MLLYIVLTDVSFGLANHRNSISRWDILKGRAHAKGMGPAVSLIINSSPPRPRPSRLTDVIYTSEPLSSGTQTLQAIPYLHGLFPANDNRAGGLSKKWGRVVTSRSEIQIYIFVYAFNLIDGISPYKKLSSILFRIIFQIKSLLFLFYFFNELQIFTISSECIFIGTIVFRINNPRTTWGEWIPLNLQKKMSAIKLTHKLFEKYK